MLLRFTSSLLTLTFAVGIAAAETPSIDFGRDIRPLLSDRCFVCHGPDSGTREAGLRLDLRKTAVAELESGLVAVVPDKPGESELIARIDSDDESMRMPPIGSGKTLSAEERALLRRWITQGAPYEKHWAFAPPQRPEVPQPKQPQLVRNPIDAFVLAKLDAQGMQPSPEADKQDLIRRVYFDLIGLPPSLEETDKFLRDTRPDAYEQLIDELMRSPHYGERMAIEWLDGARFADSNGYQNDFARTMWPWRDWVINAYNQNMPYDQFATEQLAGDLLPNATRSQRVATGFNRNNRTVTEAGSIEEEWRVENVIDRVESTGNVFLGLTIGCARCHDHKFDPISQKEFYEFYSFFNNVNEKGVYTEQRGNVAPLVQVMSDEQEKQLASLKQRQQDLRQQLAKEMAKVPTRRAAWLESVLAEVSSDEPQPLLLVPLADNWQAKVDGSADAIEPAKVEGESLPSRTEEFFGPATTFKGGERLAYANSVRLKRDQPFSIGFWVKASNFGAVVSQMSTAESFRGGDVYILEDHKVAVHLIHQWPADAVKVVTTERLIADEWAYLLVTYDGSSKASGVKIFVNGKEQQQTADVDHLTGDISTDQPFRVGSRSTDSYISGSVRDVRVYSRELSPGEAQTATRKALRRLAANIQLASIKDEQLRAFDTWMLKFSPEDELATARQAHDELARVTKEIEEFEKSVPTSMVMEDLPESRQAYVLTRGAYDAADKSQPVSPDVPDFLPPLAADAPRNRLGLARWLTRPDHPLTARVEVNREWQRFFGTGLVKTAENFGVQSEPPSHPELLDWLATEFIRSGWNVQQLQKLILTSATYRQSSRVATEQYEADPENRLLARGPRFRLKAELVRDNALAVSGLLTPSVGGPSVMPYQPAGLWEELAGGAFEVYEQNHGADLYRRSLYTYRKRTVPHPTLATFDAPSWEICQVKRSLTNTPLQSLALLNDVTYVEAARAFAERILREGGDNAATRITYGFRLATGRRPSEEEQTYLEASLAAYESSFAERPEDAKKLVAHGEAPRTASTDDVQLAAHMAVATILLNLDEAITKN